MENWYNRFKEIREKYKLSQAEIGRMINKDGTQISRYERGAVKGFPNSLYKLLKDIFTEDEIVYIENGADSVMEQSPIYGHDKIEKVLEYVDMSKEVLCKELGISQEELVNDSVAVGKLLQKKYGIRMAWFLHDDGPMLSSESTDDELSLVYYPELYASAGAGAFNVSTRNPVRFASQFFESAFGVSMTKGMHIINVVGNSMEPTLANGEMIFVNPIENEGFRDGGIYVLMCGDTILVKRVRQNPISKEYTLISDNPEVGDTTMTLEESESLCKFIGRVVGHMDRV